MPTKILDRIESPADLAALSDEEMTQLAFEIRAKMVAVTSLRGGHLAPSLGAVEIILALHRVLDLPTDHLVFDVGHQAYAHKLITGRNERFETLRQLDGLSGFPKIEESEYDSNNAGHASDSLSIALGYALARDLDHSDSRIAALVGDASFTGGMSFEALNQIGHSDTKMLIVLNDNGMSIARNVGGFASYLGSLRMSSKYTSIRDQVEGGLNSRGKFGRFLMDTGNVVKDSVKQLVLPDGMLFEDFGVTYIGPIDGHDMPLLESIFRKAIALDGPVLVHATTTKGKGYEPAEQHPDTFHGVGPFDIETGTPEKSNNASWTSVFSDALLDAAREDDSLVAITAAMSSGTGLDAFAEEFPERFIDVGIAEEHAVAMAGAMAMAGKTPVVAIYSTFLQRAFDQMMIDVALPKQHVIFCIDRSGLVGEDGPTHHGAFDISYLRTIPNITILSPSGADELHGAFRAALACTGPVAIRYARGAAYVPQTPTPGEWEPCKSVERRQGADATILAVGRMVHVACSAADILRERGIDVCVLDMRWVRPLDEEAICAAAERGPLVTLEENELSCGFGSEVLELLADRKIMTPVARMGLPDSFVEQGPVAELHKRYGLDAASVVDTVSSLLK